MPKTLWGTAASKATINVVFIATVGVAVGGTLLYEVAFAKPAPPPTPTITSRPSSPTTSTSATFSFTDTLSGVTFQCSLDGAKPAACTSPKTYTGLSDGSHTFAVTAQAGGANPSSAATATWTVDTTPPTTHVSFPAGNGVYNAGAWSTGCASVTGLCGTASDVDGVSAVQVSIRQESTGKYWNGSSFASSGEAYNAGVGTTSWSYALSRPADGSYTLHVRATDSLGNITPIASPTSVSFVVDTTAPPAPSITAAPDNPTNDTSASFSFTDSQAGVTFQCSLDGAAYSACTSPTSYTKLDAADHTFAVRAVDAVNGTSAAASYPWTVLVKKSFPISGTVAQPLFPGAIRPMNLTFTNPYNFDIRVTAVTITVDHRTTLDGAPNPDCDGPSNVVVEQGLGTAVVIPGNSTASLQSLGVDTSLWPQIEMLNLSTDQNACKRTAFTFTFSGSAAKANQ
jgi:hypothetical protein